MPPEEEQLNEVLQLRSQGMTYKQIAEKTGHPQSTVANWVQTNTTTLSQTVEVLMVNDFEPGATVITLPIHKFEFYRKSDLIYFKGHGRHAEVYEIRGTVIHKTTFPERGEMYPYFIGMMEEHGEDFLRVFHESIRNNKSGHAKTYVGDIMRRINNAARIQRRIWNDTDSVLDVGFGYEDWAAEYLDSLFNAICKQYDGFYFFHDGLGQQTTESARDAYKRWEFHQKDSSELKQLSQLNQLGDDVFASLFAMYAKEQHGLPKKYAKVALEINSVDTRKIKHFVDSGASNLTEFEMLHASGLTTFAEFERVAAIIPHIGSETLSSMLGSSWINQGQYDQSGVYLGNYKQIHDYLDDISKWPSIKQMGEALDVGFEVEEHKEYKRWILKLSNTNWELTHARINQFRQLEWKLDDLLRFDSPEDMSLHAIIETSPDTVSHAKLLENYKATHGTNLGNARNLHDRLQSPPFDTMVESDLDAGIIQKLARTKAKRKSAPKPKKTAKKDATPDVSKALVDLAKYPKLSASKSNESERVRRAIAHGDLEDAIAKAVVRLEQISKQHCKDHGLEYQTEGKGWLHDLIEQATSHALQLTKNRNKLMHQAITVRGKIVHSEPARANISQLKAALQVAEDMP